MKIEEIAVDKLIPYEWNNKIHNEEQINRIANSIKEFWFLQPIVIDKNNILVVWHWRLEGAKKLWLKTVPCLRAENLSEEQIKKYRILDNRLNESDWDLENLQAELATLSDLNIGDLEIDINEEFDDIFPEIDYKEVVEDKIPDVPERDAIVKRWDIFELWEHRVMCWDSTSEWDVEKLIAGKTLKCVFSSPPYNMGWDMYESYEDNLESKEYIDFNINVVKLLIPHLKGFLFWNISYNKNSRVEFLRIANQLADMMEFKEMIIWNKKKAMPILSNEILTRTYEDIFLFQVDEDNKCEVINLYGTERGLLYNKKRNKVINNYWEIQVDNGTQLDNHKACYPVKLPAEGIKLTTEEWDIVYDPFGWSWTNIIACEQLNRIWYCMEFDPKYVEVILKRFYLMNPNKEIKCVNRDVDINKILLDE